MRETMRSIVRFMMFLDGSSTYMYAFTTWIGLTLIFIAVAAVIDLTVW